MDIAGWMNPPHVHRGCPAIPAEAELSDPLVRPAGDDRLPGRMARRMVIVTALRTGLGITARPYAHVHRIDRLPVRERMAADEGPPARIVQLAVRQSGVEAA